MSLSVQLLGGREPYPIQVFDWGLRHFVMPIDHNHTSPIRHCQKGVDLGVVEDMPSIEGLSNLQKL